MSRDDNDVQQRPRPGTAPPVRKYVLASLVGNALEWYDFFLYSTAAAIVFGRLFFPSGTDPLLGTLGAFAGFAVGFAARPLGGIIFGHIGDRVSRKSALVMTLMIMGVSTVVMGLLPTYHQIGIWAPVLLVVVRIFQGIAAGGEWSGGVLLISENAEESKRGMLSSLSQSGLALGFVLSSLVFYVVQLMPPEPFFAWGWRIPFLLSAVLLAVGLYIRYRLPEEIQKPRGPGTSPAPRRQLPFIAALRTHPKQILVGMGLRVAENGGAYIFLSFSLVYGLHVGLDRGLLLIGLMLSMVVNLCSMVFFGRLSDKIGRRTVYAFGAGALMVFAFPFFWLLDSHTPALVVLAFFIGNGVCHAAMIGAQPAFLHELFDAEIRYSGMSLAHEVAAVFSGGVSPLIATALLVAYDSAVPVSLYIVALAAITLLALLCSGGLGGKRGGRAHGAEPRAEDRAPVAAGPR